MTEIKFSKEQKARLVRRIQLYFQEELDQELGQFPAEFLLDFFTEEIGPSFYNQGLYDAQAVFESKMEGIAEAIYEIEKTSDL
ncbi:DUF2164 domain-containing protein [Aliikangiella marina]|uniref:DUF2164 domain-containing protein n=1 Tax=Aliikangiella marina TaxID=1712262 RepID=A0A545TGZ7_9GAMM|nr:DUF2164 domain-containing protein [Aliikangiella marina]TQV76497.1 DUF2164 domain-containing protein [Aliikangiella marina]